MNRIIETDTAVITERIIISGTKATSNECNHCLEQQCKSGQQCGQWHAFRNATIRVLRRTLCVNKPGDAPAAIYAFSSRLASSVVIDGITELKIDKALRLLIRKAQKGKLATPAKIKCPCCSKYRNPSKSGYYSKFFDEGICIYCFGGPIDDIQL